MEIRKENFMDQHVLLCKYIESGKLIHCDTVCRSYKQIIKTYMSLPTTVCIKHYNKLPLYDPQMILVRFCILARNRSWNQPVLCNGGTCLRKQRSFWWGSFTKVVSGTDNVSGSITRRTTRTLPVCMHIQGSKDRILETV